MIETQQRSNQTILQTFKIEMLVLYQIKPKLSC